jgi:hypothetical protein
MFPEIPRIIHDIKKKGAKLAIVSQNTSKKMQALLFVGVSIKYRESHVSLGVTARSGTSRCLMQMARNALSLTLWITMKFTTASFVFPEISVLTHDCRNTDKSKPNCFKAIKDWSGIDYMDMVH